MNRDVEKSTYAGSDSWYLPLTLCVDGEKLFNLCSGLTGGPSKLMSLPQHPEPVNVNLFGKRVLRMYLN